MRHPQRADGADLQLDETWSVVETLPEEALLPRGPAVFSLGNGFIGVRGSHEEDWSDASSSPSAVYLNGVFETVPITYHEKLPGFAAASDTRPAVANPLPLEIRTDNQLMSSGQGTILSYERGLDCRRGLLSRRMRWRSPSGRTIDVVFERLVSLTRLSIVALRIRIRPVDFDGTIQVISRLDGPPSVCTDRAHTADDPRIGPAFTDRPWRLTATMCSGSIGAFVHQTAESAHRVAIAVTHAGGASFDLTDECSPAHERVTFRSTLEARRGETICVEKFAAFAAARPGDARDVLSECLIALEDAQAAGFETLAQEQRDLLDRYWQYAEVEVGGAPALERALRFNMFQLFQAAGRDGRTSIAAKGQSGRAYEGHYFWDAEIFCLPFFTYTAPEVARSLLEFRWRTLGRARVIARGMGHARGALFPWRTIGGDECSAYFPAGTAQYHLNAGIAHAVRQYWEATGDDAFLEQQGAELVFETARVWLEVGFFNPRRGGEFCIPGVTGPDEYSALVDNNFYTNAMAKAHLEFAVTLALKLASSSPETWRSLREALQLQESEVRAWADAAAVMHLPYDEKLGIYKQDDTFLDRKPWDFTAAASSRRPLLLYHHPLVLYRHRVCKQADSILALFLLGERFEPLDRKRTFDYYEKVTVHDSTLSPGIFSIVASGVGQADKALDYASRAALIDLTDSHGNTRDGLHMAAMGTSWMSLVHGFAGMRVNGEVLCFSPLLPAGLTGYSFRLFVQGRLLKVRVNELGTTYELLRGVPLLIRHHECEVRLDQIPVSMPPARPVAGIEINIRGLTAPMVRAVIFDLDGVIADTARWHFLAWRRLAEELGLALSEETGEALKGVAREASLEIVLAGGGRTYSSAEKAALADRKNAHYIELLRDLSPKNVLPGAAAVLSACRSRGLRIGLASASRNAGAVLAPLGLASAFDVIVDANRITHPKPAPQTFLEAARMMDVSPTDCIGVEDAVAGVRAIKAAGMYAVGIGSVATLSPAGADAIVPRIAAFEIDGYL